jgi:hypothetical protein
MSGARNVKAGLALIALSLAGGLAMSLYAFVPMIPVPEGLRSYDDLARRLLRLAHVAAVMLPLLNVVFGLLLDRLRLAPAVREFASLLLLAGAVGLPLALGAEALVPAARDWHLAGPPAVAFTLGTLLVSGGALWTPARDLLEAPRR